MPSPRPAAPAGQPAAAAPARRPAARIGVRADPAGGPDRLDVVFFADKTHTLLQARQGEELTAGHLVRQAAAHGQRCAAAPPGEGGRDLDELAVHLLAVSELLGAAQVQARLDAALAQAPAGPRTPQRRTTVWARTCAALQAELTRLETQLASTAPDDLTAERTEQLRAALGEIDHTDQAWLRQVASRLEPVRATLAGLLLQLDRLARLGGAQDLAELLQRAHGFRRRRGPAGLHERAQRELERAQLGTAGDPAEAPGGAAEAGEADPPPPPNWDVFRPRPGDAPVTPEDVAGQIAVFVGHRWYRADAALAQALLDHGGVHVQCLQELPPLPAGQLRHQVYWELEAHANGLLGETQRHTHTDLVVDAGPRWPRAPEPSAAHERSWLARIDQRRSGQQPQYLIRSLDGPAAALNLAAALLDGVALEPRGWPGLAPTAEDGATETEAQEAERLWRTLLAYAAQRPQLRQAPLQAMFDDMGVRLGRYLLTEITLGRDPRSAAARARPGGAALAQVLLVGMRAAHWAVTGRLDPHAHARTRP